VKNREKTVDKPMENRAKTVEEVVPFLVEKVGCLVVDCHPAFALLFRIQSLGGD
jgi:hypothetical protein